MKNLKNQKLATYYNVSNAFAALDKIRHKYACAHIHRVSTGWCATVVYCVRVIIAEVEWGRTLEDDDLVLNVNGEAVRFGNCKDSYFETPLDFTEDQKVARLRVW